VIALFSLTVLLHLLRSLAALETYHLLSQRWFTHASPTLFNAGTPRPQLSSCFLVCMKNDSIEGAWMVQLPRCLWHVPLLGPAPARLASESCAHMPLISRLAYLPLLYVHAFLLFVPPAGIYDTLKECAGISKSAGGIGLSMHNIRATGSYIRGTNGTSNGIVPMLRVFNDTGEDGKRKSHQ
jgi:hypothetical protein